MIIYQRTIEDFIKQSQTASGDLLVAEIKSNMREKMGRGVSPSEERSWRTTLRDVSKLFDTLENKKDQYILLEFKVPKTQKRIDVILVGSDGVKRSLLIIELKGWGESYESQVPEALRINASYGAAVSHPGREAEEYLDILSDQYSDINTYFKNLDAVALLPNYKVIDKDPILSKQFKKVLDRIELYHKSNIDDFKNMIESMFKFKISKKEVEFLNKLEYKPTLDFQKHLEKHFRDIKLSASQELAYNSIRREIDLQLTNPSNKKLFIVSGMPGSGKTVIAVKLLGYIYTNKIMTAKLQLPGPEFRKAVIDSLSDNAFQSMIGGAYAKGDHEIIIVDEAHKASGQGYASQYYKALFKNSNFVVTLIDDNQVVNKQGATKAQVKEYAQNEKFDIVEVDLHDQFRNAGDVQYIDWLKKWIFNEGDENQQLEFVPKTYSFNILKDKEFNETYNEMYKTDDVRLGSFWTQKWNAEVDEEGNPIPLIKVGSYKYIWNINNYWEASMDKLHPNDKNNKVLKKKIRDLQKTNFNNGKKGAEFISYFNTIQGSEFDYFFVHLPKLFFLNDKNELDVNLDELDMIDMHSQVWTTKGKPNPKKAELNKLYFKNRLLVNLTRGKKGTFIYCEDEKLSKWINDKIRI